MNSEFDTVLDEVSGVLFGKIDAGVPLSSLSWPAQVVVVVCSAQGIIDNGGLVYLYDND